MNIATRQVYYDDPTYGNGCYYQNGYRRCYRSAWDNWVRWVVLAVVVIGFLLLFFICSCLTARRRRKAGRQPFYGTGWAARPMPGNNTNTAAPYYNNNNNQNYGQQPAPPYSPSQANSNAGYYAGGANQGYYNGAQQNGVEMQPPQPTYGGAQYQPPAGPPPGKVA